MKLLIAGGSGFIGQELVNRLQGSHDITVLGREVSRLQKTFPDSIKKISWEHLNEINSEEFDLVINLTGSNIGEKRWNTQIKKELILSRTESNQKLTDWILRQKKKPRFFCANAVGIYGSHNPEKTYDENSIIDFSNPSDFLSTIGIAWQKSLDLAILHGIPVTFLRFGVVLKKHAGMLKKLEPSFYLGLGSILGKGTQPISWIHIDDLTGIISYLIDHPEITGAVNLSAPNPVTQANFAKMLAKTLKRPLLLKIPAWLVRLLFREMGEALLLNGQRVVSKRLLEQGYLFQYPELLSALQAEYL